MPTSEEVLRTSGALQMDSLFIGLMRDARFLADPKAADRAQAAWQRILVSYLASPR